MAKTLSKKLLKRNKFYGSVMVSDKLLWHRHIYFHVVSAKDYPSEEEILSQLPEKVSPKHVKTVEVFVKVGEVEVKAQPHLAKD